MKEEDVAEPVEVMIGVLRRSTVPRVEGEGMIDPSELAGMTAQALAAHVVDLRHEAFDLRRYADTNATLAAGKAVVLSEANLRDAEATMVESLLGERIAWMELEVAQKERDAINEREVLNGIPSAWDIKRAAKDAR